MSTIEDFEAELETCVSSVERLLTVYRDLDWSDRQALLTKLRRGNEYHQHAAKTLESWEPPPSISLVGMGQGVSPTPLIPQAGKRARRRA